MSTSHLDTTRFGSGQAVNRMEDAALVAGTGLFTDDAAGNNPAHLAFLRSPYPHARVVSIDASAAKAMPGVLLVVTGAEMFAAGVKPLPGCPLPKRPNGEAGANPGRRPLAHPIARFVGETVAAVAATSIAAARAAVEAIQVEWEELTPVTTLGAALADGAPSLAEEVASNIAAEMKHGDVAKTAAAFAAAKHVVALDIINQRVAAVTMEPRSVLASYDTSNERLTIRMSTQMPSSMRDTLCDSIGIPKDKVRVLVGDVGGGFGMKTGIYPEDCVVAWAALQLKRDVKWIAERAEEFLSTLQGVLRTSPKWWPELVVWSEGDVADTYGAAK